MEDLHFDHKKIKEILPHRYPFLLVDKVISIDVQNNTIIAQKNVSHNEEFFQGHFPETPIMPGVLVLEALAQAGGILIHAKGYHDKTALLMSVNQAKFRKPIYPGDVLMLHVQGRHFSARAGKVFAEALVDDTTVAQAEIGFSMLQKEQI